MKNCPNCGNIPIAIREWFKGLNVFRCNCRECGIRLKGSVYNYLALLLMIACALGVLGLAHFAFNIEISRRSISFYLLVFPSVYAAAIMGYFIGSYSLNV